MTNCLKDCYNLHKWKTIETRMIPLDFSLLLNERKFTDVDTMGAVACSGGACEVNFD